MVRDEGDMLQRWIRHYGGQTGGTQHLLVLDDNSSDGSTTDLPCPVVRIPELNGQPFNPVRMKLASGFAAGLLAVYDFVVYVDVDEFLVADPDKYADLREFLAARPDSTIIAPMGLNVVHHTEVEPDLDPDQPVLGQRRFAKFVPIMCKPAVKQIPAAWFPTPHEARARFVVDPELYLFHLKFSDRQSLAKTAALRYAMFEADGRGQGSSWSRDADDWDRQLREFVAGAAPDLVPEFDPASIDLASVVHADRKKGTWRAAARGQGQVQAMLRSPLYRIPDRFFGTV
jgi:hypothetical protein